MAKDFKFLVYPKSRTSSAYLLMEYANRINRIYLDTYNFPHGSEEYYWLERLYTTTINYIGDLTLVNYEEIRVYYRTNIHNVAVSVDGIYDIITDDYQEILINDTERSFLPW